MKPSRTAALTLLAAGSLLPLAQAHLDAILSPVTRTLENPVGATASA